MKVFSTVRRAAAVAFSAALILTGHNARAESPPSTEIAERAIADRARAVIASVQPDGGRAKHPKYSSYEFLGRAAQGGCLDREEYEKLITGLDEAAWGNGDYASRAEQVFALPPVTRYALQFSKCLSPSDLDKLRTALELPRLVLEHGTVNHWSMRASSIFLLSERFPDLVWSDISTGKHRAVDIVNELKPLLVQRFLKFFEDGNNEQFSPVYQAINFFAVLNLADFALDKEVRSLAESSATVMLASLRANSFHGQIVPPLTRANFPQRSGLSTERPRAHMVVQFLLWFYFGEPLVTAADLKDRIEPFYPIMFALSTWRPPAELLEIDRIIPAEYEVKSSTPTFSKWALPTRDYVFGSSYISDRYAIGVGNGYFRPSDYNGSDTYFGIFFKSRAPENGIECYHPYWLSNYGADTWKTDRSSPFQQQWREGSKALIITKIPELDPWPQYLDAGWGKLRREHALGLLKLIKCRLPNRDNTILEKENSILLNVEGTFVGIRILGSSWGFEDQPNDASLAHYRILKVQSSNAAIYFELATSDQIAWESFVKQFSSRIVTFDASSSTAVLQTDRKESLRMTFELFPAGDGWIRSVPHVESVGTPAQSPDRFWLDTPFLTIGKGRFRLKTTYGLMEIKERSGGLEVARKYCGSSC
jgi:hypothetical protein